MRGLIAVHMIWVLVVGFLIMWLLLVVGLFIIWGLIMVGWRRWRRILLVTIILVAKLI